MSSFFANWKCTRKNNWVYLNFFSSAVIIRLISRSGQMSVQICADLFLKASVFNSAGRILMEEQRDLRCGHTCWCSKAFLDYQHCCGLWSTGTVLFRKFTFLCKSVPSIFSPLSVLFTFNLCLPLTFVYKGWGGVERRRSRENTRTHLLWNLLFV